MTDNKSRIYQSISSILPEHISSNYQNFVDFLKQYYVSQEFQGGVVDISRTIDSYKRSDVYTDEIINGTTILTNSITENSRRITVQSTAGWPEEYGLLKIGNEIIYYSGIEGNTFTGCVRGFSGVDNLKSKTNSEKVNFVSTTPESHSSGSAVTNLNALIAQELFRKYKNLFAPGIGDRSIANGVDKNNLLKQIRNFYQSKGTEESVKILFRALFGEDASVIKPQEYLFTPSDSEYDVVEKLVCRCLSGDPLKIKGSILIQEEEPSNSNIKYASGSITDVEALSFNTNLSGQDIVRTGADNTNTLYYLISLSSGYNRDINTNGTIEGDFAITPKTLTTQSYSSGNVQTITVDSTISFPESGFFFIEDQNQSIKVGYRRKNINQFLECFSPETGRAILPVNFQDGSIVRGIHSVFSYEDNDVTKKVEFVITGVLGDYESGGVSKIVGTISSPNLNISGVINGSGYISGSNTIFGTGVISGTNTELDGNVVSGKISGFIEETKIKGIISETGISTLDGAEFSGEFLELSSFPQNLIVNDPIRIKSIGKIEDPKNYHFSSWLHNVSNRSRVKTIDAANQNSVKLTTFDDHQLILEDRVELIDVLTNNIFAEGVVTFINNEKTVTFDMPSLGIDNTKNWDIRRKILFGFTNNDDHRTSNLNTLVANVQNTYTNNNDLVYVASESIPSYEITTGKNIREFRSIDVSDSRILVPDHGFFSGDSVFYTPKDRTEPLVIGSGEFDVSYPPLVGINTGFYYIIRYDNNTIGLSLTRNGVRFNDFVSISSNRNIGDIHQLIPGSLAGKSIRGQKLFKIFPLNKEIPKEKQNTEHGPIGMFVNGVEIINYKSPQRVHYGKLESIEVLSGGSDYDVINLPNILIADDNGFGAVAKPTIDGKVVGVALTDTGFDIIGTPKVTLVGGNGVGCLLDAKLSNITHEIFFDASPTGYVSVGSTISTINTVNDTFRIENYHKFRDADEVVYNSFGNTPIRVSSGVSTQLVNNSLYYVSVVSPTEFRLHEKKDDAINKINHIDIVGFGTGRQSFKSTSAKKIISDIVVVNPGSNYRNKERIINTADILSESIVGINTVDHLININNHDYQNGDVILYRSGIGSTASIGGLIHGEKYIVTVYDKDNFRLSKVGISSESFDRYYSEKKYIKFSNIGFGEHIFNYPPIELKIDVESNIPLNYGGAAYGSPIVRGSITSVSILNGGRNYGSQENVIDLDTSFVPFPKVNVDSGSGAVVEPVIQNGEIKYVIVKNGGSGYTSPPDLILSNFGEGIGAKLVSVIKDGRLESVIILSEGLGYSDYTSITVKPVGSDCILKPTVQTWTVNLFERNKKRFSGDDGFIVESTNSNLGLKYGSLYAPRNLRKILKTNGGLGKNSDLEIDPNQRVEKDRSGDDEHSPIIGWAYDGNPIYGPYGYVTNVGGGTTLMRSGYKQIVTIGTKRKDGPDTDIFPPGFFVEDYEYQGTGDLDEHNGRFCVTPEFPNGTYAYFCTFSSDNKGADTRFTGFKEPVFPYVIGNSYYSVPLEENLKYDLNQLSPRLNELNIVRNTYPYKFGKPNSVYEYCIQPHLKTEIESKVIKTSSGYVNSVSILNRGNNYKIGDNVIVDMSDTGSSVPVSLKVGSLVGAGISSISYNQINFNDVVLTYTDNVLTGLCTQPHEFRTNDVIEFYDMPLEYKEFEGFNKITVPSVSSQLSVSLGSTSVTGIFTSLYLNSSVSSFNLGIDNIVGIGSEEFEILNIDDKDNSLYVRRMYRNTSPSTHNIGDTVFLKSKTFKHYSNKTSSTTLSKDPNIKFNFIPNQTVGVGTVGISTFLTYISLGKVEQREVKVQSIYIPNHNLKTGQKLTYSFGDGSSIGVSTNTEIDSVFNLQNNSTVYAINLGTNFVGLSTSQIRLGSSGTYVGVNTTEIPYPLYFRNFGIGNIHSLETTFVESKCKVKRHDANVQCLNDHLLEDDDKIEIDIESNVNQKYYEVEYNNYIRKLIINPKTFNELSIDTDNNTIEIQNHQFKTGDEVIYESQNPALPLKNNEIYYVVKITDNLIKLTEYYFDSQSKNPPFVSLVGNGGNGSSHRLSLVNPKLDVYRYESVGFGVSHPSLRDLSLQFFKDSEFTVEFGSTETTSEREIVRNGISGVDSNATVTLILNENYPKIFYYQLIPSNVERIRINKEFDKLNILPNRYVKTPNTNKIELFDSFYNQSFNVKKVTDDIFAINLTQEPERDLYGLNQLSKNSFYVLKSDSYFGPIHSISILQSGKNLQKIPKFVSIDSINGSGADIFISGKNIGRINKVDISSIGFEFNSDKTLKPVADVPSVLQLDEFYKLESIDITFGGQNYLSAPKIIFYDKLNGTVNDNIIAYANINGSSIGSVTLVSGGYGLSRTNIVPVTVNNDNGINILNSSYNTSSKLATLTLETPPEGFTTDNFPFTVGDKIFVEGVKIVEGSGTGYNSENYQYEYFTIKSINPNPGVANESTISYEVTGITTCGVFASSFGRVVKEDFLPKFSLNYASGSEYEVFLKNESITFPSGSAIVVENKGWDDKSLTLRVNRLVGELRSGDIIKSVTTGAMAKVKNISSFEGFYQVSEMSTRAKGSLKETGKNNNTFQRLHDNNYYQKFSYSIKSAVNIAGWDEQVDSLIHTAGYKKFSDLNIISSTTPSITGSASTVVGIVDLINIQDVERIHDYDLVSEDYIGSCSKNVFFNGKQLTDYFKSEKNRVIVIDDISSEFRSNADNSVYTVIDSFFGNTVRTCKYIIQFYDPRKKHYEFAEFLLTHNNFDVYINDYTGAFNKLPFGTLDAFVERGFIEVRFTPYDQNTNIYIKAYRIGMRDDLTANFNSNIGFAHRISQSKNINLSPGTPTQLIGISSTLYTSLNFIAQVSTATSNYSLPNGSRDYQSTESVVTIQSNGDINYANYGDINTFRDLGEFSTRIDPTSKQLSIDFTLNPGIAFTTGVAKMYIVGITTTNNTGFTTYLSPNPLDGNGSVKVRTSYRNIPPTSSIESFTITVNDKREYRSIKYFIQVEDQNLNKGVLIVNCIHDGIDVYTHQYAIDFDYDSLGDFDVVIVDDDIRLLYTPPLNIGTNVKVFSEEFEINSGIGYTTFGNTDISVGDFVYEDKINRYRYSFALKHNGDSIFSKKISPVGIATTTSSITFVKDDGDADDHFFVTGEELVYDYAGITTERISISPITIVGIGTTDKLPDVVFAIKDTENTIRLAKSKSDALSGIAITITDFYNSNDPIEERQSLDSLNPNKKCIIQIDNIIQQPLTWTSIYYNLNENIGGATTTFSLTGVTSITNGDILKIDDEFVYVEGTNFPNINDVIVRRAWMGTNLNFDSSHGVGSIVRLYRGDYNIVKDIIYFKDAPYGSNTVGADFLAKSNIRASSSFQGRFFQKSSYDNNVIFDDISTQFSGIGKTFTLSVEGNPISGIALSESNSVVLLNNIFQKPGVDYNVNEVVGISTNIVFTGRTDILSGNEITSEIDVNKNDIPRGGIIISVGSSQGYGYQPLIRASGIATVSAAGTIIGVNIGTSYYSPGAGYTDYTFPGSGYTQQTVNITFDDPENNGNGASGYGIVSSGIITSVVITSGGVGYASTNPPKVTFDSPIGYINLPLVGSLTGIGASVSVTVGQGSSVIDFEIVNNGYNYRIGDVLTPVGIPTNLNSPYFEPFEITVTDVWYDKFASWNVGNLELLVDISTKFDGIRRSFVLERQGDVGIEPLSIEKGNYGAIDLAANLLVLLDGVLQQPGKDYIFNGGTTITFTEPPRKSYSCLIFFYRGEPGDTIFSDIDPPIEIGDELQLYKFGTNVFQENEDKRTVVGINSSNSVKTNVYCGLGQSKDESVLRPVHLIRQRKDIYNLGEYDSKKRLISEPNIRPTSNLIRSISSSDTVLYLDSLSENFNYDMRSTNGVKIVSQDFDFDVDFVNNISISGGHGTIIGVGTSAIGINTTSPMVEFTLVDKGSVGTISSGIESGVYFVVFNSNVGSGLTSIEIDGSDQKIIGIGTTFIDNVYRVDKLIDTGTEVKVYCNVLSISGISSYPLSGIATNGYYFGNYSWGRIVGSRSSTAKSFVSYSNQGLVGIQTSPVVTRILPFKVDV